MRHLSTVILLLFSSLLATAFWQTGHGSSAPLKSLVITDVGVVSGDGSICPGMAVVVGADGNIEGVIPSDQVDGDEFRTVQAPAGAILAPGLHDLFGSLGGRGSLQAGTKLWDWGLSASEGFDPTDPHLGQAAREGILYTTIAAAPSGLVNGKTATFLCQSNAAAVSLGTDLPFFALSGSVLDSSREPTSRVSMVARWKTALHYDTSTTSHTIRSNPGFLYCPEAIDLRQALDAGWGQLPVAANGVSEGNWGTLPVLIHDGDARSPIDRLAARTDALMVVGPFQEGADSAAVDTAVRAAEVGVELAFRGGLPRHDSDHLRRSAAIAVAAGLDPAAARRALFSNPARAVEASNTGVIAPGARADLVLFSTDPLDPGARVLKVWVAGERLPIRSTEAISELGGNR